ncbi:hypothetical protein [Amycolatopsis thermoflava]|uniref:hypothetical protein n=1 Tax=Amycolatopsis thermoflava TaxID=84480 RepID=UPI003F4A35DD
MTTHPAAAAAERRPCDFPEGCSDNAVFNTTRCLQHAEPVTTHGATAVTPYHGAYDRASIPAAPTPRQRPAPAPAAVPARPYDGEPAKPEDVIPGPLRLTRELEPAELDDLTREWQATAQRAQQPVEFGEPVGFDEPPARGWLARAIEEAAASPRWTPWDLVPALGTTRCCRCHRPWRWVKQWHTIWYKPGHGQFALCERCWQRSTPAQRWLAHSAVCDLTGWTADDRAAVFRAIYAEHFPTAALEDR